MNHSKSSELEEIAMNVTEEAQEANIYHHLHHCLHVLFSIWKTTTDIGLL